MKIMHLISGGDVGGAKTQVLTLLQELCKQHKATLTCFMEGPFAQEAREMGIPTQVFKTQNPVAIRRMLVRQITRDRYDIVHCHGAKANLFGSFLRRALDIPVISTVHSDPKLDYMGRPAANLTYGAANRTCLRHRDGWVAVSDSIKEILISRGFDGDKIETIYNGIAMPKKIPCKPRAEYLRDLGLDWDESCVIYGIAARLNPVKDVATLIRAFAKASGRCSNMRLLIAGDGELRQELEALAGELCPAGSVKFIGWQSDMNSFYHCINVNMLSSISEAFPYAILEGARMYCATVSTAVGGVPKVLQNESIGFLVDPGDWESMGEKMAELAEHAELRSTLGRNIYEKVQEEFSAQVMAAHQVEFYRRVIRRREAAKNGRYGAVICGAYGRNNAGDEAILRIIIRQLRQQDPDLPICVMTRTPRETSIATGVSTAHILHWIQCGKIMRRSTLYISGGGTLIQNITSTRSLFYYLASISQAKRSGCRVMMYGCGAGPVSGAGNRRRVARILNRDVDRITLRDPESRQTLREFGVVKPEITVTADPAMLMQADEMRAEKCLVEQDLTAEQKFCLFVLRPWDNMSQKIETIRTAAEYGWKKYDMLPVFICFEPTKDETITRLVMEGLKVPCRFVNAGTDGELLCGIIRRADLVISMRLHALIFACSQNTNIVGISYDPKVSGFMNYLGSPNCLHLSDLTGERLCTAMDRAMEASDYRTQVVRLKQLAEENGTIAGKLLYS